LAEKPFFGCHGQAYAPEVHRVRWGPGAVGKRRIMSLPA
jgi:hypothetical protein